MQGGESQKYLVDSVLGPYPVDHRAWSVFAISLSPSNIPVWIFSFLLMLPT